MSFKHIFRTSLIIGILLMSTLSFAILPENIGGTQYGIGYIAATDKMPAMVKAVTTELGWSEIKYEMYYHKLEQIMLSRHDEVTDILKNSNFTLEQRGEFFDLLARLQDKQRYSRPKLFMLGNKRAIATDGHHRVRNMVKLKEAMEESSLLWPDEVRTVLTNHKRIDGSGKMILSLDLINPRVVAKLSAKADAATLMREILIHKSGLWLDPADVAMAAKFGGTKNVLKASKKELRYLAAKLGILDGPTGLVFTPVTELPDYSLRSLVGKFFASRGFKDNKVAFKDYVEFYIGDEIKDYAKKNPTRYPALTKMIHPDTTIAEQKAVTNLAYEELEHLFAVKKGIAERTLALTYKGKSDVAEAMEKVRFKFCFEEKISTHKCEDYIESLSKKEKMVLIQKTKGLVMPVTKKNCKILASALKALK